MWQVWRMRCERWIEIDSFGRILLVTENDGYSYMRHGAERNVKEVTLNELKNGYGKSPHLWETAVAELKKRNFPIPD